MSLPVFGDRVQETFTTTGTGTISLGGAVTGYQAFSAILADGKTCYYGMTDGINWEIGLGTYASSGNTLARTTVIASSNANAAVNWAAGTKSVWLDLPATLLGIGQILGTNTNDNASAGNVGEVITSTIAVGSAVSLSNGVSANIASITLTPGDWDVQGTGMFTGGATTSVFALNSSISLTSATLDSTPGRVGNMAGFNTTLFNTYLGQPAVQTGIVRMSVSVNTTVYLVSSSAFTTSTCSGYGSLIARRVR